MKFLKRLLGRPSIEKISTIADFWIWFTKHQKQFHAVVKKREDVEKRFLDIIGPALHQLNEEFYCVAGMEDEHMAELVVTAEGDIKTFVFVEQLMQAAPPIPGWMFTALKPATGFGDTEIAMDGYVFSANNLFFSYSIEPDYPDEIEITLAHPDLTEENRTIVSNGCLLFLDSALGEYNSAMLLDLVTFTRYEAGKQDWIAISKLPDFLNWRQKEFVEKYQAVVHQTDHDQYSALEATDEVGRPLLAIVNTDLLQWDAKASHPWMLIITMKYDGAENNGMPNNEVYEVLTSFEDTLISRLPDVGGYLYVGRETYNNERKVYIACREFRQSSIVTAQLIAEFRSKIKMDYTIFKDKYWRALQRFQVSSNEMED
jgi:hypothetical protein